MSRIIDIKLTNRKGRSKMRRALVFKENREQARYTRITYVEPKAIRNTAFLSHDFHDEAGSDNRWFYMPATRKVRRIPAADRGDYFLGTDFTYEDIQSELKFNLEDYDFKYEKSERTDHSLLHHMSGIPVSRKVAKELGYGSFEAIIDEATWMPTKVVFAGLDNKPLKTIFVDAVEQIDGIWTATSIRAVNHKTGHQTHFQFNDTSFQDDLDDNYFDPPALTRGLPRTSPGASR